MAWSEIQKAINSVLDTPLNVLINNLIGTSTATNDTTVFGKLNEKVRPYKQLKLTSTKSPICTSSQQPKGVMVDYNAEYYLIVSNTTLWKMRREVGGDVIVGSVALPLAANNIIPIVINDLAFFMGGNSSSVAAVGFVNLITLSGGKQFPIPATSTGGISQGNTKNQHFDVRHVSGNQYQVLVWVDGATADGIIVCTLDTTATSGATMAQVSFKNTNVVVWCCFGMNGDTNYYFQLAGDIYKAVISTGVSTALASNITDLALLDPNSFRSCQTADYLIAQVKPATGNGLSDVIMIKKTDGSYNYCGIENDETITVYVPCQVKNADYFVFANQQSVYAIKNDKTVISILKSQSSLFNSFVINNITTGVNALGQRFEGILNHDIPNNKVTLSGACFFDANTLANTNTFAIREYSIV